MSDGLEAVFAAHGYELNYRRGSICTCGFVPTVDPESLATQQDYHRTHLADAIRAAGWRKAPQESCRCKPIPAEPGVHRGGLRVAAGCPVHAPPKAPQEACAAICGDGGAGVGVSANGDLRAAAAWIADAVGYPIETRMPDHPMPQALWDALVDHVQVDVEGKWHGNELDRDEVESWLTEEAGRDLDGCGDKTCDEEHGDEHDDMTTAATEETTHD